jgi:hypothetical protein
MSSKQESIKVESGQIWQDCDYRMTYRFGEVDYVDDKYAYLKPVSVIENRVHYFSGMKNIRIRLDRMRPSSRGWKLVDRSVMK